MIKAIETSYAGHRFRSRLEARWAVFFDALGIPWQYEVQGFEVSSVCGGPVRRYLPDFHLPTSGTWVEVKGDAEQLDFDLLADLVDWGGALPGIEESVGSTQGLLLLGDIPRPWSRPFTPVHPILQHHEAGWVNLITFTKGGLAVHDDPASYWFDSSWGDQASQDWVEPTKRYFTGTYGLPGADLDVQRALVRARSARFEHGQAPG